MLFNDSFRQRLLLLLLLVFAGSIAFGQTTQAPRLLVFSKTTGGFRHESIGVAKEAIGRLGKEYGFEVDSTEDASWFSEQRLKQYQTVIFLSTSGNMLNAEQEAAFEAYIRSGKGFVGVHGAAAGEYEWEWYGRLIGGYFDGHPEVQKAKVIRTDLQFQATSHLPGVWEKTDEWYNYKQWSDDNKVVLKVDETSYTGGTMNNDHPIAWYKEFDGGRMFYTGLGHTKESYQDPDFLKHLAQGILYAMGH